MPLYKIRIIIIQMLVQAKFALIMLMIIKIIYITFKQNRNCRETVNFEHTTHAIAGQQKTLITYINNLLLLFISDKGFLSTKVF